MRTITQLDIDMPRYCCARPIAVSFPHRREYKMSYRSNRVRQTFPIAVRSQDDRPWSVRTTFVADLFFHGRTGFFRKIWSARTNFLKKIGPRTKIFAGPKFP